MRFCHGHQQRKSSSYVGATAERDLADGQIVGIGTGKCLGIDAVAGDQLRCLARERIGFMDVGGGGRLVHQLSNAGDEIPLDR